MNRPPRWRPRLALLVGIWLISGIGIATPARYADPVRAAVDDALRPGRVAAITVTQNLEATLSRFRAPESDDELETLQSQVAVLRARAQQQQAQQVALIQQASAESAGSPLNPSTVYDPLLTADLVSAAVIGRQPDVLRARFARILSRGTTSHITVDDLVLADAPHVDQGADIGVQDHQPVISGSVVVGSIGQAGRWTSTLQLVTDPAYRANVQLVRESRSGPVLGAAGVLLGNGSDTCVMHYVSRNDPVSVGDSVYSRQQDADQTEPLYYGRVVAVNLPAGTDDWSIEVEPAFDPADLKTVQILTVSLNPQRIGEQDTVAPVAADAGAALFPPPVDDASQH